MREICRILLRCIKMRSKERYKCEVCRLKVKSPRVMEGMLLCYACWIRVMYDKDRIITAKWFLPKDIVVQTPKLLMEKKIQ